MFTYYGGKRRAAHHYPKPTHDLVVEPFAGSAGYSLLHYERQILLRDLDPFIVRTWQYLITTPAETIAALPDIEVGQPVTDLDIPDDARLLIGWWLNKGAARPMRTLSAWAKQYPRQFWGPYIRERIASQVNAVRHWRIDLGSYEQSPDIEATWFIDPPYLIAGHHYRCGSTGIDYPKLGDWCKQRLGQVIVCEADDAAWLPFRPLAPLKGTEGKHKINRARTEVVWP